MDKARIGGAIICILVIAVIAAFIYGIYVRNFWATAIPIAVGVVGVGALVFWIGWTMLTTKVELPPPPEDEEDASTPAEESK